MLRNLKYLFDVFNGGKNYSALNRRPARPIRFLVAGHDLKFMGPYIEYFSRDARYELRVDEHPGHEIASEKISRECLDWADVIFCEWALGNLVWYSNHKKLGQLLFSRLHLQEWQHRDRIKYLYKVKWENVDRLLLTSHHIYDHMIEEFPSLSGGKARVLYCPIDTKGFYREKSARVWKHLGIVGIVPQRKRLDLAIDILRHLQVHDPAYTLHIKSRRPEEYAWMRERTEEMEWYKEVYKQIDALPNPDGVIFEPHGNDMPDWFTTTGFLLSTSDFEGSHQAVAESMAAGCIPIIRNWEGSNRIYPPRFVWDTTKEASDMIFRLTEENHLGSTAEYAIEYADKMFDQKNICTELDALIMRLFSDSWPAVVTLQDQLSSMQYHPNILILGYLSPGYRGGYRTRIEQEIRAMLRWGGRIHFVCLHPRNDKESIQKLHDEIAQLGCLCTMLPADSFFDPLLDEQKAAPLLDLLEQYSRDYKIEICHAEALYCARIALLLRKRLKGIRVVFDCHGISPEEEEMGGLADSRTRIIANLEREVLFDSDMNIMVSRAMIEHYKVKYGYNKNNAFLLPCCVSENQFSNDDTSDYPIQKNLKNYIVLAYVGTLAVWQCGKEMISLFSRMLKLENSLHLLLILPEKEHLQAHTWMTEYAVPEDHFTIMELPHAIVSKALYHAHAGMLLRKEHPVNKVSSPTKYGEYLAAGIPVILTDNIGDFSAYAKEYNLGHIVGQEVLNADNANPDLLADIVKFIKSVALNKEVSAKHCRTFARENLHWEVQAKRLLRAYILKDEQQHEK